MNNEPFVIERVYNAPVEKVWQAITDKDQMKQWYFNIPAFEPKLGFEFSFEGNDGDKVFVHLCKVTEVNYLKRLAYSWAYAGFDGYSVVTFDLSPEGDKTKLKLTHAGLETFPQDHPSFAKANFSAGWTEVIGTLLPGFVEKN
ncbi:SRPBCC domain-containing protein [Mucilaginibacter hurinus]|uniref:SRPBCC domain-containing protein n=1 Tax=Mucilaginibacter hurinus TaxID=2201324 RepID=A0A367GMT1_9SPHI|nr:SRPBCC domain-containing protein [Mucilaginibacter hurinus]RCH54769.1 SRPBCC domain-containing protein [Mucilaginibacter hurinus]